MDQSTRLTRVTWGNFGMHVIILILSCKDKLRVLIRITTVGRFLKISLTHFNENLSIPPIYLLLCGWIGQTTTMVIVDMHCIPRFDRSQQLQSPLTGLWRHEDEMKWNIKFTNSSKKCISCCLNKWKSIQQTSVGHQHWHCKVWKISWSDMFKI